VTTYTDVKNTRVTSPTRAICVVHLGTRLYLYKSMKP